MDSPGATGRPRHLPRNAARFDFACSDALKFFDTEHGLPSSVYRGRGDEVAVLIVGKEHKLATDFAESIRAGIEKMDCQYKDTKLPKVTASLGIATSPPSSRAIELENLADDRQTRAKNEGKNRVIAS